MKSKPQFSSALALFTFFFLIFFFTLLNGYLQNLVADYRSDTRLVLAGVVIEMIAVLGLARRWIALEFDTFEVAGFMLVVGGVWTYFIIPALPTFLPPTQSSDAVRVYLQVLFSYPDGKLVSWYPAGASYVTAMFAHWFNIEPLRILHPTVAIFLALSAGAVYGITSALLPKTRASKIMALVAPALLFVPWSYFAGTINWEQYFVAQVFAQYFILAALWYIAAYADQSNGVFAVLIGASLLAVVAAYPIFVALPLALFGLVVLARLFNRQNLGQRRSLLITLAAFIGLMILAAGALQRGGILEFAAGKISVSSDVGAGGVTNPSIDNLGGPIFLAMVLVGAWFAWRSVLGKTILGLLFAWVCQFVALVALQPFLQISGYRVDKTFYILVFPFAILATLCVARVAAFVIASAKREVTLAPHASAGVSNSALGIASRENRARNDMTKLIVPGFIAAVMVLSAGVWFLRPPKPFSPLTESEIQVAQWAKKFYMETYQIAYLDDSTITAYWLVFGIWREVTPNEWFQWIPAGRKLGPATFDEWAQDPGWHDRLLVRYLSEVPGNFRVVYQYGDSAILTKDVTPDLGPKPPHRVDMTYESALTLIGYDLARTTYKPGETITLTTWTQSLYPPPATVAWRVELVDRAGQVVNRIERDPFNNKYPLQRWPPGKYSRDVWAIPVASDRAPGAYDLQMSLFRRASGELMNARMIYTTHPTWVSAVPIARIKIPLTQPSPDELRSAKSLQARLGDVFAIPQYQLQTETATRRVQLTLYWQSLKPTDQNYTAFVHVLDASGQVVAQQDAEPLQGKYPTAIWDAGEIVKDEYNLAVPADARAPFKIEIGMYVQPSLQRLPVSDSDHVELQIPDF